jgi:phosphoenolpyruvate carboxykinase (ATP)
LLSAAELYEYALLPEHLTSVDPSIYATTITDTGALSVSSGSKTGRTPKEKRVVLDETTKDVSSCPISINYCLNLLVYIESVVG